MLIELHIFGRNCGTVSEIVCCFALKGLLAWSANPITSHPKAQAHVVFEHLESNSWVLHFPSQLSCQCFHLLNDRMWQTVPLARVLSKNAGKKKSANSARALKCTIPLQPNRLTLQNPGFWIKTAILCCVLNPPGCLAAGGKRKTFGSFWHIDKRREREELA